MAWKRAQFEAINDYAKRNNLKVSLGAYPYACFIDDKGILIKKLITHLETQYTINKREDAKERERNKKEVENKKRRGRKFS